MLQDLRYACRTLLRAPSFTVAAVLTLAIGIAVNTIVFTLLNSLALRAMPVRDADRVVRVFPLDARGERQNLVSYADYLEYRGAASGLEGLAAYIPVEITAAPAGGEAEDVIAYAVSANYLPLFGVEPALGRAFEAAEESPASAPVAIISQSLWRRRFASDPSALGAAIVLNSRRFTIVGVGPERFAGTEPIAPDIWVPLGMQSVVSPGADLLTDRDARWLLLAGRIDRGRSRETVASALTVAARRLAAASPSASRAVGVVVVPGTFFTIDPGLRPIILLVMGIVGLVLAIACANVANLVLARTSSRQRELAVRLAIGASRWRVVRQLVTETTLVGLIGGVAGLLLSVWTLRFLYPVAVSLLPFRWGTVVLDLTPDLRVFAYTFGVALIAGIALGLVPAVQGATPHISAALHDDGAMVRSRFSRTRLRHALVVIQIAVCLMLLVGAGLLARGLQRARALDLGFQTDGVVFTEYDLRRHAYTDAGAAEFNRSMAVFAAGLPGVHSVALTSHVPLTGGLTHATVWLEGHDSRVTCLTTTSSPAYFDVLRVPVVAGRNFTSEEAAQGAPIVIISEGLAARFWPGASAVGRTMRAAGFPAPLTVVGVVRDTSSASLWRDKEMSLYVPLKPAPDQRAIHLLVRASRDTRAVVPALRERARALDARVRFEASPLESVLQLWILPSRVAATAAAALGGVALLLASVGIYAVLAFAVAQRRREIGVRMALGATARDVTRLVLRDGVRLIALGLAIGQAGALAVGRVLRQFVFDIGAFDPLTFILVPGLLCLVALAACYVPARHATRIAPLTALRMP